MIALFLILSKTWFANNWRSLSLQSWDLCFPNILIIHFLVFSSRQILRRDQTSNSLITMAVILPLEQLSPSLYQRAGMIFLLNMPREVFKGVCQLPIWGLPDRRAAFRKEAENFKSCNIKGGMTPGIWERKHPIGISNLDFHNMWTYRKTVCTEALKWEDIALFPKQD